MSRRIEPHTVLPWLLLLVIITSHFGCAYSFRSRSIAQNSDDLTLYPAPINPSNSGRNDTSAPPHLTAGFALNVTVDVPICDNDPSRRGSAELNSCIDAIERVPDTKDSLLDSNTKRRFRYSSCELKPNTGPVNHVKHCDLTYPTSHTMLEVS